MKTIATIILLSATSVLAQRVITYDPRFDAAPERTRDIPVIDITNTNTVAQPDYAPWMRRFPTPAIIDTRYQIGVTITGTVQQARADLRAIIREQFPARDRMTDRNTRDELRESREKLKGQGRGQAQRITDLEAEVTRLAEIVEYLFEQSESFK
ncbi:MAG TPA: hypothetical protein PKC67_02585 [Kiritimatiellia bacterium]|nr:hypothetical protein [Kiritimatiellia bacterium]HMP33213.1 hypothetical protein [Kiritimatiellia bacterium]